MRRLFIAEWPYLLRAEAALLFPVAVATVGEFIQLLFSAKKALPLSNFLGDASHAAVETILCWSLITIATAAPFVGFLVAVDRLLSIRNGRVLLSCLAAVFWVGTVVILSDFLKTLSPPDVANSAFWMPLQGATATIAATVGLVINAKILWAGAGATPFAAASRIAHRKVDGDLKARLRRYQSEAPPDPKTSVVQVEAPPDWIEALKMWLRHRVDELLFKVLVGFGFGITLIAAWIYFSFDGSKLAAVNDMPAPMPPAAASVSELSVDQEGSQKSEAVTVPRDMSGRDGEATAERGEDGLFHFKVSIRGMELPMVYDDDVRLVTLRAEDAKRLGLVYERLDFSTKIKTDNGLADVAAIIIQSMTIGTITYHRVLGYAAREGALAQNILGHSFIGRLSATRMENDRLTLTAAKASMSDRGAAANQKQTSSIGFPRLP